MANKPMIMVVPAALQKAVREALPPGVILKAATVYHPSSPMWPTCKPVALKVIVVTKRRRSRPPKRAKRRKRG